MILKGSDALLEPKRVLIVGGSPEPSSVALVVSLANQSDAVVAVDRGLDILTTANVACDMFCGDADSVSERGAAQVRACEEGACGPIGHVERYNPHKDFTDLDLALRAVEERWPGAFVTCTCLTGGNPDHALAVYGRLAAYRAGGVELREDDFCARVLHGPSSLNITGSAGKRFSFVPLSSETVVSERGMRWELDHVRVALLSDLGISNVIESDIATFSCHEGVVATWLFG